METKRVLLTGVAGSIGVHVLGHIMHNTDWFVVGLASFRHRGWTDRINEVVKDHPDWNDRYVVYTHDLTAPLSPVLKGKIGHVDYIINLASLSDVEASIQEPGKFVENNVSLMVNMLEYAREAKPESFIQFSTDEVYGPTAGKIDGYREWDAILPSNPYAASKACQEAICVSYWRTYSVPVIITNTMNNVGEMQSPSKFPVMVQRAVANDEEITIHSINGEIGSRSYLHSRNAADALLFILRNTTPYLHSPGKVDRPERYNIAGDVQLDNLELAQMIAKGMGKELKYRLLDVHSARPGHDPHYGLDDSKLRNLGWKPPVSFEESLKNVIKWQTDNPIWIK